MSDIEQGGNESTHQMSQHEFARRMPKVELHIHLEGSIRPATLLKLAQRNDISLPAQDVEGLRDFYRFRDFDHFIQVYFTITGCLRTPDDYRLIAYEFGADCARQNIRYAEVTFTMNTNIAFTGLDWREIMTGLNQGRAEARAEFGVDWGWVLDINRNRPETQGETLDIALVARERGDSVLALGLGGSEADFPAEMFVQTFERAYQAGLPRVPHSGETSGPTSVWATLRQLRADRIGHGVRSVEDPALITHLRDHQIPLEVCPTSNIRLGVYPDYDTHPLRRLWEAGLLVTVNSDDPPMFGADLNHEYQVLVDHFDFDRDDLECISLNGVRASLLPEEAKARLETEFRAEFAQLNTFDA